MDALINNISLLPVLGYVSFAVIYSKTKNYSDTRYNFRYFL